MNQRNANKRIPMCHSRLIGSKESMVLTVTTPATAGITRQQVRWQKIEVKGISQRTVNTGERKYFGPYNCVSIYPTAISRYLSPIYDREPSI